MYGIYERVGSLGGKVTDTTTERAPFSTSSRLLYYMLLSPKDQDRRVDGPFTADLNYLIILILFRKTF